MDNQLYEQAINKVREMNKDRKEASNKYFKRIDFELLERVFNRLIMFSNECSFCKETIPSIVKFIDTIYSNKDQLDETHIKEYKNKINEITNHMEKEHKLYRNGHFIGIYMPIGMCFGVTFGIIFNNLSIGISLGLLFGVLIGNQLDADAKKKGRSI